MAQNMPGGFRRRNCPEFARWKMKISRNSAFWETHHFYISVRIRLDVSRQWNSDFIIRSPRKQECYKDMSLILAFLEFQTNDPFLPTRDIFFSRRKFKRNLILSPGKRFEIVLLSFIARNFLRGRFRLETLSLSEFISFSPIYVKLS